ncbi:hypothetical protein KO495_13195 [Colwellia sp. D2M02]|uniref:hypothetical protein n=1 Tax=Colwellia sp. D2M02 TaxID=2841562 RepID=UPI001C098183|nr:hypothetical protein [Colwellia sp. D2M02]MBU2894269.1 hypothetical protein [Colwellia sp. D2M02]
MKLTLMLICILCSYHVSANENKSIEHIIYTQEKSPLEKSISQVDNVILHQQDFEQNITFHYGLLEIETHYSNSNNQRAPAAVSLQEQYSDFYLNSELTIQSSDNFDISMSTNIYQDNLITLNNQQRTWLPNNTFLNNHQGTQYSFMGNYNISSSWKISGGIVLIEATNNQSAILSDVKANNIALFGTSYRF